MQRALFSFGEDPFAIRALAGVLAYGTRQPFAGAWMDSEGKLLIGRTENALTVCGTCSDEAELAAFLDMIGGEVLLMPEGLLQADLPGWTRTQTGVVLADPAPCQPCPEGEDGTARHMASILADSPSPWIQVGDRDALYVDLSHRLRHGCVHGRMRCAGGEAAACALTMGETDRGAVIGGVACRPAYRGQGLAGSALTDLCAVLQQAGKRIFLFTGEELHDFYRRYGFSVWGRWQMYGREDAAE